MKKHIEGILQDLKYLYPNEKINVSNGFIGVENGERLKHTTYIGIQYFAIDNILFYDMGNRSKKVIQLN